MKTYKLLKPNKTLTEIVTYPEKPESDIELYMEGSGKSIVPNKEISKYIKSALITELIDNNLAMEIAKDYPHLFDHELLNFLPNQKSVSTSTASLFSNLSIDLSKVARDRLTKLDQQIKNCPNQLKFKIDRAELLFNSGEYTQAKLEFDTLLPLAGENGYYEKKIKDGLTRCELKLDEVFKTPFRIIYQSDIVSSTNFDQQSSDKVAIDIKILSQEKIIAEQKTEEKTMVVKEDEYPTESQFINP
jgi:hypothetical protein